MAKSSRSAAVGGVGSSAALAEAHPVPPRHWGVRPSRDREPALVGLVSTGYGAEKLTYGLPLSGYAYRQLYCLPLRKLPGQSTFWQTTRVVLDRSVPLLHTFNDIPISNHRFVISFENELPRYFGAVKPWQFALAFKRLADRRCMRILAMSDAAAEVATRTFEEFGWSHLGAKLEVFRGGVPASAHPGGADEDRRADGIRLLFVGRHAFHKGIVPLVEAVEECNRQGLSVRLSIVGDFEERGYVLRQFLPSAGEWRSRVANHAHIDFLGSRRNTEVRALMREHDALVFPSFDESLGWVAIEASMDGLPVIATDIFAMRELVVPGLTGELIPLNCGSDRRWRGLWLEGEELEQEIAQAYRIIRKEITNFIGKMADNLDFARTLGTAARKHAQERYGSEPAARRLESIYREALEA